MLVSTVQGKGQKWPGPGVQVEICHFGTERKTILPFLSMATEQMDAQLLTHKTSALFPA